MSEINFNYVAGTNRANRRRLAKKHGLLDGIPGTLRPAINYKRREKKARKAEQN